MDLENSASFVKTICVRFIQEDRGRRDGQTVSPLERERNSSGLTDELKQ
jgi:hypothetical protein